ncbi:MAG: hypothetical protein ACO31I_18055 [Prochlorotrichaceae cyanobacterium]
MVFSNKKRLRAKHRSHPEKRSLLRISQSRLLPSLSQNYDRSWLYKNYRFPNYNFFQEKRSLLHPYIDRSPRLISQPDPCHKKTIATEITDFQKGVYFSTCKH